ncbi:MAG: NUDIX hydrolase [Anaerolineales bacterium]
MIAAVPIVDVFCYAGQRVRATWCPAPWRPPLSLVSQCSGLCYTADGQMVLVSKDGCVWALPGGHLEADETLEQALRREVREEVCATITDLAYLGCQQIEEAGAHAYYQARFWARLALDPFAPAYEIAARRVLAPEDVPAMLGWHSSILTHLLMLAADCAQRHPLPSGDVQ